jgi:hypothetical protein
MKRIGRSLSMRAYWIHYSTIGADGPRRFGIIESDQAGRQNVITPPGRTASPEDVVRLLVARGANAEEAMARVEAAMRNGIAHLLVKEN